MQTAMSKKYNMAVTWTDLCLLCLLFEKIFRHEAAGLSADDASTSHGAAAILSDTFLNHLVNCFAGDWQWIVAGTARKQSLKFGDILAERDTLPVIKKQAHVGSDRFVGLCKPRIVPLLNAEGCLEKL